MSKTTDPLLQEIVEKTFSKLVACSPDEYADQVIANFEKRQEEKAAFERFQHMATTECRDYERTDLGNSKRLFRRYGKDIRYCHPLDTWYIWNGIKWEADDSGKIQLLAKDVSIRIGDEAAIVNGDSERSFHFKWAGSSQQASKISAMVTLVKSDVPILIHDLDRVPNLLNCPNCAIDLETLKPKKHDREDFCTKVIGVPFDPLADCPVWKKHLNLIFQNDISRVRDFQQLIGYSLLSDNPEQLFFIAHGGGCNGKGVTMNTIAYVVGEYCTTVSPETLMAHKNAVRGGDARADLVDLIGARLILSSENEKGTKLAEGLIKMMTGDDSVSFRGLYEKRKRKELLTGKLWLSTNHMPRITGTDFAIWRRVCRVPFEITIPEEERDTRIKEKLKKEGSGILNWMLEGLKMINSTPRGRLTIPEWVRLATEEYKKDSDILGQFLIDPAECQTGGTYAKDTFYIAFVSWCEKQGVTVLGKNTVRESMRERGFQEGRNKKERFWVGVSLAGTDIQTSLKGDR